MKGCGQKPQSLVVKGCGQKSQHFIFAEGLLRQGLRAKNAAPRAVLTAQSLHFIPLVELFKYILNIYCIDFLFYGGDLKKN